MNRLIEFIETMKYNNNQSKQVKRIIKEEKDKAWKEFGEKMKNAKITAKNFSSES